MALGKSGQLVIANRSTLSTDVAKRGSIGKFLNRSRLVAVVLIPIVAGLIGWFWLKPATSMITANGPILAALSLLTTLNLFIRWLRWHFLARCFNLRLPAKNSLKLYLITLPALIIPLHLGELLRAAWVNTRYPHAWTILSKVWLTERLADAVVLGVLLLAPRLHWGVMLALTTPLLLLTFASNPAKPKPARAITTPTMWSITVMASSAAWLIFGLGLGLALPGLRLPSTNLAWLGLEPGGFMLAAQVWLHGIDTPLTLTAASLFWLGSGGVTLLLGLAAVTRWRGQLAALVTPPQANQHFNTIASGYSQEIPGHVRDRLISRKVAAMQHVLQASKLPSNAHGLDLGCGPGWYAAQMAQLGYRISACDFIPRQAAAAHRHSEIGQTPVSPQVADAGMLPYANNSFDFIYSINLLHHLASPQAQQETLAEVVRVLKPGGIFFLQEINTHNPLFAFYMGYVFPLLRNIDEGTEHWLNPSALPYLKDAHWSGNIIHFTFLPDFTPQRLLPLLTGLEKFLETHIQRWSAHYVACLVKEGGQ